MRNESFIMYMSFQEAVNELTNEEKGILLDAIYCFHADDEIPEMPKTVKIVFSIMKQQFERDRVKYQKMVDLNRLHGKMGGRPTKEEKPSGFKKNQPVIVETLNDAYYENKNNADDDLHSDEQSYQKIIKFFKLNFYKGQLYINDEKIRISYNHALSEYSPDEIYNILAKAAKSKYIIENGYLDWILQNLKSIETGKYDNKHEIKRRMMP